MVHILKCLSNAEYRTVDAYSKSDLDEVLISPSQLEWSRNCQREETDATEIGTAVHSAILEPEAFNRLYMSAPAVDMRTASGKASDAAFRKAAESNGRIVLSHDDYQMVIGMRDSVMVHPTARAYLTTESGQSEPSIIWEQDGVKRKCRPDHIPDPYALGHTIIDVKSIDKIELISKHARDFNYHVQDCWYSDGYEALHGVRPRFIFIFVAKTRSLGRYPVRVIELNQEWKDAGREKVIDAVDRLKEMESFGSGYDVEVLPMKRGY